MRYIFVCLNLIWGIGTVIVAMDENREAAFIQTLEKLLSFEYIPEDNFSEHYSIWQQLLKQGTKRDVRVALRAVLQDPTKEDQWRNALRLASDAEMDEEFILDWSRHNLRHGKFLERGKLGLFDTAVGKIRTLGTWEDVNLLVQVADELPREFALKKQELLIHAHDEMPFSITQREKTMKESGITRMGPEPDKPANRFETLPSQAGAAPPPPETSVDAPWFTWAIVFATLASVALVYLLCRPKQ